MNYECYEVWCSMDDQAWDEFTQNIAEQLIDERKKEGKWDLVKLASIVKWILGNFDHTQFEVVFRATHETQEAKELMSKTLYKEIDNLIDSNFVSRERPPEYTGENWAQEKANLESAQNVILFDNEFVVEYISSSIPRLQIANKVEYWD